LFSKKAMNDIWDFLEEPANKKRKTKIRDFIDEAKDSLTNKIFDFLKRKNQENKLSQFKQKAVQKGGTKAFFRQPKIDIFQDPFFEFLRQLDHDPALCKQHRTSATNSFLEQIGKSFLLFHPRNRKDKLQNKKRLEWYELADMEAFFNLLRPLKIARNFLEHPESADKPTDWRAFCRSLFVFLSEKSAKEACDFLVSTLRKRGGIPPEHTKTEFETIQEIKRRGKHAHFNAKKKRKGDTKNDKDERRKEQREREEYIATKEQYGITDEQNFQFHTFQEILRDVGKKFFEEFRQAVSLGKFASKGYKITAKDFCNGYAFSRDTKSVLHQVFLGGYEPQKGETGKHLNEIRKNIAHTASLFAVKKKKEKDPLNGERSYRLQQFDSFKEKLKKHHLEWCLFWEKEEYSAKCYSIFEVLWIVFSLSDAKKRNTLFFELNTTFLYWSGKKDRKDISPIVKKIAKFSHKGLHIVYKITEPKV
jgi:hypothetical protein